MQMDRSRSRWTRKKVNGANKCGHARTSADAQARADGPVGEMTMWPFRFNARVPSDRVSDLVNVGAWGFADGSQRVDGADALCEHRVRKTGAKKCRGA